MPGICVYSAVSLNDFLRYEIILIAGDDYFPKSDFLRLLKRQAEQLPPVQIERRGRQSAFGLLVNQFDHSAASSSLIAAIVRSIASSREAKRTRNPFSRNRHPPLGRTIQIFPPRHTEPA
jgi:hypothetical protein